MSALLLPCLFIMSPAAPARCLRCTPSADELFAAGINGIVGPLDVQYVRAMYNGHCFVSGASQSFTTFEGLGCPMESTPEREWLFVVGSAGLDRKTWTFDIAGPEPVVEQGMMVQGLNAKKLSALLP